MIQININFIASCGISAPGPHLRGSCALECPSQNFLSSSVMLGIRMPAVWQIVGPTWALIPVCPFQDPLQPPTTVMSSTHASVSFRVSLMSCPMGPVFPPWDQVRSRCYDRAGTWFKVILTLDTRKIQTSRIPISLTPGLWACIDLCVSSCSSIGSWPSVFWLP